MVTAELTPVLYLARDEERRFAQALGADEREVEGTLDRPAPKDVLAHALGARVRMSEALAAARTGARPDPGHDRRALFEAHAGRPFALVERDGEEAWTGLLSEVARLDADALASSPSWVSEATIGDEIIQQCATHSLAHLLQERCERGDAGEAIRTQERFLDALPADASARQHSRALYNLACLLVRGGRADDAVGSLGRALELRPTLLEHARSDVDLAAIVERSARRLE